MVKFITDILKSVITYLLFVIILFVLSFSFATKEFPPSLTKMRKGIDSLSDMMKMAQGLQAKSGGTSGAADIGGFDIGGMAEQISNLNKKNLEALNAIQEANTTTTIQVGGSHPSPDSFKERFAFLERQNQNILSKIDRIENYLADLHSKVIVPQATQQIPSQQNQQFVKPAIDPAAAAATAAAALKAKALQAQQK